MCIETSQTFYNSGRDMEPSVNAFILLRLHQSPVEGEKEACSCRLDSFLLVPAALVPQDRLLPRSALCNHQEPFRGEQDLTFCVYLNTNPPSKFS